MIALPQKPRQVPGLAVFAASLVLTYALARAVGLRIDQFPDASKDLSEYLGRFAHPRWSESTDYVSSTLATVLVGFVGTCLSMIAGAACLPLILRGVSPHPVIRETTLFLVTLLRSVPDPAFAIALLMLVGAGPQGGALALALHGTGFVAKTLMDAADRLPEGLQRGVQASGASPAQVYAFAILPSLQTEAASLFFYCLDRNFRMAATLGILGSGGLGLVLKTELDSFHYDRAAAALLVLVAFVLCFEVLSSQVRAAIARK